MFSLGERTIELLISEVESLVTSGILNRGEGRSLTSKLAAAMEQLDRGNVTAAINQVDAFLVEVAAMIGSGRLTPDRGNF